MSRSNRYKWLIVVEGNTDRSAYGELLARYGVSADDFTIFPAHGKSLVCNAASWGYVRQKNTDLLHTVIQDSGRRGFSGIILIVDSDGDKGRAFDLYRRSPDARLRYIGADVPPMENMGGYWRLDTIDGARELPVCGITVPVSSSGSLETDLLSSYGFPVEGQEEYAQFVNIIRRASGDWRIQKHGDGRDWWEVNQKAKLDKFIYSALAHGFRVSGETPRLPAEPDVIRNIKAVISRAQF